MLLTNSGVKKIDLNTLSLSKDKEQFYLRYAAGDERAAMDEIKTMMLREDLTFDLEDGVNFSCQLLRNMVRDIAK